MFPSVIEVETRMSVEVCILASGSGGNCTIVRSPGGTLLIDAGLGPRNTAKRMNGTGAFVRDVSAVCLTHLDSDHFSAEWAGTILKQDIRVFCHADGVSKLLELAGEDVAPYVTGFTDAFQPLPGLTIQPVAVAHDEKCCNGFVVEADGWRMGFATDLGHVPAELVREFVHLDVLAIESNYDPQMQVDSARPAFLKSRIMGGRGHLSNRQAFDAVREILDRHERFGSPLPSHVVLLHRSRQCNCPRLVRKLFLRDPRLADRLILAEQFQRTDWLRVRKLPPLIGEQLVLGWG
jgi:phosphoribosyl 1,2-cyclic phosphodiesterase